MGRIARPTTATRRTRRAGGRDAGGGDRPRPGASAGGGILGDRAGDAGREFLFRPARCRGAVAGGEPCPDAEAADEASGGGGEPCRNGAVVGGGVAGAIERDVAGFSGAASDGNRTILTPPALPRSTRVRERLLLPVRPFRISRSDVRKTGVFRTSKVAGWLLRGASWGRFQPVADIAWVRNEYGLKDLLTWVSIVKAFRVPALAANLIYHDVPGIGPAIVFVHGLGCASSCDYLALATHSPLAGRRMILVDLLGSGFSERPRDFAYTIERHAEVVSCLISEVCAEPVDLFGHSMGGAVAIAVAARLGSNVRRIALSEPNLDPGGGTFSRQIASMSEDDYVLHGHEEMVCSARASGNVIWASSLARSAAFAVHREATSLVAGCAPSWRETFYAMTMQRTVIFGAHSLPNTDFEDLPRHACAVEVVADAGHSMALENPSGLAAALHNAFH